MALPSKPLVISLLVVQLTVSGCFNISRYTDGPLTQYLSEPLPELDHPLARTLSVEKIEYNTAAGMKGTMISDLVAREIYFLPGEVGREVDALLRMDDAFSQEATLSALNAIARGRQDARHMSSGARAPMPAISPTGSASDSYIARQEALAKAAYEKGDYLGGNIHNAAAVNRIQIDRSFAQAQATADLSFSVLNAMQAAGEALIKGDFNKLRGWLEQDSGAIGPTAPEGTHLSAFFLQYFDAESFQLDSRMRVAVYLVLTDQSGASTAVLEGSDVLICESECDLFQPKPTAQLFRKETQSSDIQDLYWTQAGLDRMNASGFDNLSGIYQYVLLQHGLKKLAAATSPTP